MIWKNYISSMTTLDDVLTDANLRQDLDVLECEMSCARGEVWKATLKIVNPGLAIFAPTTPIYYAIIESPDGTLASGRVLCKGRMSGHVSEMTNDTITVELICAPADLQTQLWNLIRATPALQALPNFDDAMDDLSWDKPGDVLKAIGSTFYVDPVTHVVSVNPMLEGDTIVNLDKNYVWNSFKFETSALPPVQSVKLVVQAEWTQVAIGAVNIAPVVNGYNFPSYGITTCTADFAEFSDKAIPGKYLNFTAGSGWTQDRNNLVVSHTVAPMLSGRVWQYNWDIITPYQTQVTSGGATTTVTETTTTTVSQDINEIVEFGVLNYFFYEFWYRYDYQQQRRETLTILYDYQIQPVAGAIAQLDLGTATMRDLTSMYVINPTAPPEPDAYGNYQAPWSPYIKVAPFSPLTIYNAGDYAAFSDAIVQCQTDGTQGDFYVNGFRPLNGQDVWINIPFGQSPPHAPAWHQVVSDAPIPDPTQPSYFDTLRGGLSIEHALLRCRSAARQRSEIYTVSFDTSWDEAISLTMLNRVLFTVKDRNGNIKPMCGKVTKLTRKIGRPSKMISVELKIPVGIGSSATAPTFAVGDMSQPLDIWMGSQGSTLTWDQWSGTWSGTYLGLYNFTQYYGAANLLGTYGFQDILFAVGAQPLIEYIDPAQLGNADYAVVSCLSWNEASSQLAYATAYAQRGVDPRDAIRDNPTFVEITMRNLSSNGVLERLYDCAASSTTAIRGIDLSTPTGAP